LGSGQGFASKAILENKQTYQRQPGAGWKPMDLRKTLARGILYMLRTSCQWGAMLKSSVTDKLMFTLQYLRKYRTMEHIGYDWNVTKSTVCESIKWGEDMLMSTTQS
jgi:hypothetical protein